jgi:hypothetical protein
MRIVASSTLPSFRLLCRDLSHSVLDGKNAIRPGFSEALLIDPLDENRERSFPRFLVIVGEATEFAWVHA